MRLFCYFLLLLIGWSIQAWAGKQDGNNPQPQADDLILPLPAGQSMVFRPVCMGEGSGSYAWKRFRVGDPAGGYKESPTAVALGGAFKRSRANQEADWCYYLGKYEVSESQVAALTGQKANSSQLPARNLSWLEVEDVIRAYNQWLYTHADQALPRYGGIPGYLRLPTEYEWEFAARGGSEVENGQFDRKTPYPKGKIQEYEWFSGPKSSHNKVKKIGLLKANALGLHDMLGNVAEMTRSLYQVEYYQGRSGGFVAKGGHYLTDGGRLRSSLRTEQEFYALDRQSGRPVPAKKQTLGFRLLISSLVFPNRQVSQQLDQDWEAYRQGYGQNLPAAVSTSATSIRTKISGMDAGQHLNRLRDELVRAGRLNGEAQQELDLLAASLEDIQFTLQQAEKDSAYAWIKIGNEQAFFLVRESKKIPVLTKLIQSATSVQRFEVVEKYREREVEIKNNIKQALSSYSESIRQLATSGKNAVETGFSQYGQFLQKHGAEAQLQLLPVVHQHIQTYMQNKRIDDELWQQELIDGGQGQ